MSSKKRNHYVNNKQLLQAMIEYRQKVQEAKEKKSDKPRVSNYIGTCLLLIATNLAKKPHFYSYTYKDEMISDGIENCIRYIDNFDPAKSSNPFAYFTQIISFAFIRRIQREKKEQYVKIKNMQNSFIFGEIEEHMQSHDSDMGNVNSNVFDNEITSEFIKNFEATIEKKKVAAAASAKKQKGIEQFIENDVDISVVG